MFNPREKLSLSKNQKLKLKEIVDYMIRNTNTIVTNHSFDSMNFEIKENAYGREYTSLLESSLIYYHIPKFFGLRKILIDIGNPSSIIEVLYLEYEKKTAWEEKSVTKEEKEEGEKLYEKCPIL